jgi:chemotaxis protein MotB
MHRFVQPTKGMLGPAPAGAPLKDIQAQLEKALAPEIKSRVVDLKPRKEGLIVSLREMGFYDSGASTMRESSLGAIDRLASVITPRGENLRIEGHTDNVPIHSSRFPSNWELSTARSSELVKLFIFRYHVDPSRLSAAGYAEFHPVDENSTPEGRAHNRRVDIIILNPALAERSPFSNPSPITNPLPAAAPRAPDP